MVFLQDIPPSPSYLAALSLLRRATNDKQLTLLSGETNQRTRPADLIYFQPWQDTCLLGWMYICTFHISTACSGLVQSISYTVFFAGLLSQINLL